jgi:hypothetical protein
MNVALFLCRSQGRNIPSLLATWGMDDFLALRANCSRCQALCCVALPFDQSESFYFDKVADEPCRHLTCGDRCDSFATLAALGQPGCSTYDCYGAGQRVCHELFAGQSWREAPGIAPRMFEAFRLLRRVHELRLVLRLASLLPLRPELARELSQTLAQLEPPSGFDEQSLLELPLEALELSAARQLRACGTQPRRRLPQAPLG